MDMLRYGPAPALPNETLASRRERLLERIGDGVAIIPALPELLKSRDTEVPYRASSDLFYLTGLLEPGSCAVLTPHDDAHRFTLFVRPRNPEREAWAGRRIGVEGAAERFGADAVYPIDELWTRLPDLLAPAGIVHYPVDLIPELDAQALVAVVRARSARARRGTGPIGIVDLEEVMGQLRVVKEPIEVERMRVAGRIAAAGHREAMCAATPGVGEWEVQAALEATFLRAGAAPPAFPSIVGAGANGTILHYVENNARIGDDDLVLIDAGAEWGMYCSDITRTFPASGRFTPVQRDLYDIVLAAEQAAIETVRPGAPFTDVHDAAVRVLTQGMLDLGVLRDLSLDSAIETGAFRRYYMHQTSHWLGLDVHDAGSYREDGEPVTLREWMVLTVEPGIYLPEADNALPEHFRGIGIRIEDDALVTASGSELLTRDVPVEPDEVEALVRG